MFTGIIEELGNIEDIDRSKQPLLFTVRAKQVLKDLKVGDSVSVNGACLTVTDVQKDRFSVEVIEETLSRTNLKDLKRADKVNLEAALKAGQKISGHFVTGHIDGTGKILKMRHQKGVMLIEIGLDKEILIGIVDKGSVAVDGISLTVSEIREKSFCVYIIPHTAKVTTLGFKTSGDTVNIELDLLGKYVQKRPDHKEPSKITEEFLKEKGFI